MRPPGKLLHLKFKATYMTWSHMKRRCGDLDNKRYGGRGITVCKRWMSFENFLEDMGERLDGTTLDRKDNDRGYSKSNCRWATKTEQARNRITNVKLMFDGKLWFAMDLAKHLGISQAGLMKRLRNGISFSEPDQRGKWVRNHDL